MKQVQVSLTAKVHRTCDVLVVGGGVSGIAAAIGAARRGKQVTVLEQSCQLGGMATSGNVGIFMSVGNVTGIYRDICKRLVPAELEKYDGGHFAPQFDPVLMRYHLLQMARELNIEVFFSVRYVSPLMEQNKVYGVTAVTREGLMAFCGSVVIDCTGDGRVCIDSGADYHAGRKTDGLTQPASLMFQMQDTGRRVQPVLPPGCCRYETLEDLPQGHLLHWERGGQGTLLVNMTRVKGNGAVADDVNRMEEEALKQMFSVAEYLQRHGFENYILSAAAPQTGVRETNQIVGEYTLSDEDVRQRAWFDDVVAQTDYEIDIHDPNGKGGTQEEEIGTYEIPYRCMIPKNLEQILVAGRAISVTHLAVSSLRVMPTCLALGQAAGVAGALACEAHTGLREVHPDQLHAALQEQGVCLERKGITL